MSLLWQGRALSFWAKRRISSVIEKYRFYTPLRSV